MATAVFAGDSEIKKEIRDCRFLNLQSLISDALRGGSAVGGEEGGIEFGVGVGVYFSVLSWHSASVKHLDEIRRQFANGEFDFTQHAFKRAVERNISAVEIQEAGATASVIEDYPDDKYMPSALLLGWTAALRPLHLQVSYADAPLVRLITLYEPDLIEWSGHYTQRR